MIKSIKNTNDEYVYYSKLFYDKFKKKAYIYMPGGSEEKTIDAIKKCLEQNKDILDELLYPDENNLY